MMTDTINRLAAQLHSAQLATRNRGLAAGRNWAAESADYESMQRLAVGLGDAQYTISGGNAQGDFLHLLRGRRRDAPDREFREANRFFHDAGVENSADHRNVHFIRGFAEGAAQVWNEVKFAVERRAQDMERQRQAA